MKSCSSPTRNTLIGYALHSNDISSRSPFLVGIALTSARIQYQPANEKTGEKYADRADFYVQLADDMMYQVDNTAQSEDAVISEGKHKYK
jgi:hypothetical protein